LHGNTVLAADDGDDTSIVRAGMETLGTGEGWTGAVGNFAEMAAAAFVEF